MYKDPLSKKLIDIMGNQELDSLQRSWILLDLLHDSSDPNDIATGIKVILETYGLAPRHQTPVEAPDFPEEQVASIRKRLQPKVDHELKGWFEVHRDRPLEKTVMEICIFLEEFTHKTERAIAFQMMLASHHVPIPANYFSRYLEEASDDLILREHASAYIRMRQLINLNIDPTARGSLVLDFLAELHDDPRAQSIVLGAFIEELLRRLKNQQGSSPQKTPSFSSSATFPISPDMNPEQLQDMMKNFKNILPPEVLKQLRKLFGDDFDKGF